MMPTLLVIDDNVSVRESLRFLLLRRGYQVELAESGPAGIALARERAFDGAMIDVQMPGMNGIDVCRVLKEEAAAAGRPLAVWMMTGGRSPELIRHATDAGALALLGKPFDFVDLYGRFDEQWGPPPPVQHTASSDFEAPPPPR
ncbi:MAG: response regulator [Opitutaceae bacterium]|nr:response regulator [Opitutaceae bacterium]